MKKACFRIVSLVLALSLLLDPRLVSAASARPPSLPVINVFLESAMASRECSDTSFRFEFTGLRRITTRFIVSINKWSLRQVQPSDETEDFSDKDKKEIKELTKDVMLQTRGRAKWLRSRYRVLKRAGEGDSQQKWMEDRMVEVAGGKKPTPKDPVKGFEPGELKAAFEAMGWHLHLTYYPYEYSRTAFNHILRWGFNWVHYGSRTRIQIGPDLLSEWGYLTSTQVEAMKNELKKPIQDDNYEEPYLLTLLTIIRQPHVLRALLAHPAFDPVHHGRERAAIKGLARVSIGEHYPSTVYIMRQRVISSEYGGSPVRISSEVIAKTISVVRELADNNALSLGERKVVPTWLQILVARAAWAQKRMMLGDESGWTRLSVVYGRHLKELAAFLVRTVSYARLFGLILKPSARRHLGMNLAQIHDIAAVGDGNLISIQSLLAIEKTLNGLEINLDRFRFSVVDAVGAMLRIGKAAISGMKSSSGKPLNVTTHERNVLEGLPYDRESQDIVVTGLLGSLGEGVVNTPQGEMDRRVFLLAELNRVLRQDGYLQLLVRRKLPKEVRQALGKFGFTIITEPNARLFYSVWTLVRLLGKYAGVKVDRDRYDRLKSRFYGTNHLIAVKTGAILTEENLRSLAQDQELVETLRKFSDLWDVKIVRDQPDFSDIDDSPRRRQPEEVHLDNLAFNEVSGHEADPTGITRQDLTALMHPGQKFYAFKTWLATLIWGQIETPPYLTINEISRLNEFLEMWDDQTEESLPLQEVEWVKRRALAEARKPKPRLDQARAVNEPHDAKAFPPASLGGGDSRDSRKRKLVDIFESELKTDPRLLDWLLDPRTRDLVDRDDTLTETLPDEPVIEDSNPEPEAVVEATDLAEPLLPIAAPPPAPLSEKDLQPFVRFLADCLADGKWAYAKWPAIPEELARRGHPLPEGFLNHARDVKKTVDSKKGQLAAFRALYDWIDELNEIYLKERHLYISELESHMSSFRPKGALAIWTLAKAQPIETYPVVGLDFEDHISLYAIRNGENIESIPMRPLSYGVNDDAYRQSGFRRPGRMTRPARREARIKVLVKSVADTLLVKAYQAKREDDSIRRSWDKRTPPYVRWSPIGFSDTYLKPRSTLEEILKKITVEGSKEYQDDARAQLAHQIFILLNTRANSSYAVKNVDQEARTHAELVVLQLLAGQKELTQTVAKEVLEKNFKVRLEIDRKGKVQVVHTTTVEPPSVPPLSLIPTKSPATQPKPDKTLLREGVFDHLLHYTAQMFANGLFDESGLRTLQAECIEAGMPFPNSLEAKTKNLHSFLREGVAPWNRNIVIVDWLSELNRAFLIPYGTTLLVLKSTTEPDSPSQYKLSYHSVLVEQADEVTVSFPSLPLESLKIPALHLTSDMEGLLSSDNPMSMVLTGMFRRGDRTKRAQETIADLRKISRAMTPIDDSVIKHFVDGYIGTASGDDAIPKVLSRMHWKEILTTTVAQQGLRLALRELEIIANGVQSKKDSLSHYSEFNDVWISKYIDPNGLMTTEMRDYPDSLSLDSKEKLDVFYLLEELSEGPDSAGAFLVLILNGSTSHGNRSVKLKKSEIVTLFLLGAYLNPSHSWDLESMLKTQKIDVTMLRYISETFSQMADDYLRKVGSDLLADNFRFRVRRDKGKNVIAEETSLPLGKRIPWTIMRLSARLIEETADQEFVKMENWTPVLNYLEDRGHSSVPMREALQKVGFTKQSLAWKSELAIAQLARPLNDALFGPLGWICYAGLLVEGKSSVTWVPGVIREKPFLIEGMFSGSMPIHHLVGNSFIADDSNFVAYFADSGILTAPGSLQFIARDRLVNGRKMGKERIQAEKKQSNEQTQLAARAYRQWLRWLAKGYRNPNLSVEEFAEAMMEAQTQYQLIYTSTIEWPGVWDVSLESFQGKWFKSKVGLLESRFLFVWSHLQENSYFRSRVSDTTTQEEFEKEGDMLVAFFTDLNAIANDPSIRSLVNSYLEYYSLPSGQMSVPPEEFKLFVFEMIQEYEMLKNPELKKVTREQWMSMPADDPLWEEAADEILNIKNETIQKLAEKIIQKHFTARIRVSMKDRKVLVEPLASPVAAVSELGQTAAAVEDEPVLSEKLREIFLREYRNMASYWPLEQKRQVGSIPNKQVRQQAFHVVEANDVRNKKLIERVQNSKFTQSYARARLETLKANVEKDYSNLQNAVNVSAKLYISAIAYIQTDQAVAFISGAMQQELESSAPSASVYSAKPPSFVPLFNAIEAMLRIIEQKRNPDLDRSLGWLYHQALEEGRKVAAAAQPTDFLDQQSDVWHFMIHLGLLVRNARQIPWKEGTIDLDKQEVAARQILTEVVDLNTAAGVRDYDFHRLFKFEESIEDLMKKAVVRTIDELQQVLSPEAFAMVTPAFILEGLRTNPDQLRQLWKAHFRRAPLSDWTMQRVMHLFGSEPAPERRVLDSHAERNVSSDLLSILNIPMQNNILISATYEQLREYLMHLFQEPFPTSVVEAGLVAMAVDQSLLLRAGHFILFIRQLNESYLAPLGYLIDLVTSRTSRKFTLYLHHPVSVPLRVFVKGENIEFLDYPTDINEEIPSDQRSSIFYGTSHSLQKSREYTEAIFSKSLPLFKKQASKNRSNPDWRDQVDSTRQLVRWHQKLSTALVTSENIGSMWHIAMRLFAIVLQVTELMGQKAILNDNLPLDLQEKLLRMHPSARAMTVFALQQRKNVDLSSLSVEELYDLGEAAAITFASLNLLATSLVDPQFFLSFMFSRIIYVALSGQRENQAKEKWDLLLLLASSVLKMDQIQWSVLTVSKQATSLLHELSSALLTMEADERMGIVNKLLRQNFHLRLHLLENNQIEIERFSESKPDRRQLKAA